VWWEQEGEVKECGLHWTGGHREQPARAFRQHALSVERLTVAYFHGDQLLLALDGATLEVKRGSLFAWSARPAQARARCSTFSPASIALRPGRAHVHGRVALIFQESALLPWLTAAGNVELALELRVSTHPPAEARLRAAESSSPCGIREAQAARALGRNEAARRSGTGSGPGRDVLLMDEPFGALDAISRDLLHEELERIWKESRLTILFRHPQRARGRYVSRST